MTIERSLERRGRAGSGRVRQGEAWSSTNLSLGGVRRGMEWRGTAGAGGAWTGSAWQGLHKLPLGRVWRGAASAWFGAAWLGMAWILFRQTARAFDR